jgi:hypothetical protein
VKNNDEKVEAAKRQSSTYPYLPLNLALKISDAVKELGGGRSPVPKSVLASHLNENEKAATFLQRIISAKCFGLLEGRSDYALTELAKHYYFPTSDSDKSQALLECFATPTAFGELIRRFDGDRLPKREILGNILHRELRVPESWKERAAAFFSNSAQFVGVIDTQGFLRFRAASHQLENFTAPHEPKAESIPQAKMNATPIFYGGASKETNVWNFSYDGKSVRLETPTELSKPLWEKLNAYVQLLKPSSDKMK